MSLVIGSNTINFSDPVEVESFLEQFFTSAFDTVTAGTATANKVLICDANTNVAGMSVLTTGLNAGATKTLTAANAGNIIAWNALAGSVVTLPVATGSGIRYRLYVSVLATSNSHILYTSSANAVGGTANNFVGIIGGMNNSTGAYTSFAAAATSNTVTLNRTTTGSVSLGEYVDVTDVALSTWLISGVLSAAAAAFVTPFSHT